MKQYYLKLVSPKAKERLKKIGIAGFIFFLLKGILWLAVGYYFLA